MSERDRVVLAAIAPIVTEQPSNWKEAARRLAAAVERFPGDAQIWYERGWIAHYAGTLDESNAYLDRAVLLDPGYAWAEGLRVQNLTYQDRFEEAHRTIERCVILAPSFRTCRIVALDLLVQEGACAEAETQARQLAAIDPTEPEAHRYLANALASQGRSIAAVREAVKPRSALLPEDERPFDALSGTLALSALAGDFKAAEQAARDLAREAEPSRRQSRHGWAARWLAQILVETGRLSEAGEVAERYLERCAAWERDSRSDDFSMAADATPVLLSIALRAGRLSRGEFRAQQAEWVQDWDARADPLTRRYTWMHGRAATVETPDEAREALASLHQDSDLPRFRARSLAEAAVGTTFLLAGRVDEAITWLEEATRTCRALEFPIEHTRAYLRLGLAWEAKGDKARACDAYRVVLERWGQARPRSVTADKAGERTRALACPR